MPRSVVLGRVRYDAVNDVLEYLSKIKSRLIDETVSPETVDGVDVSSHASRHIPGGSDPLLAYTVASLATSFTTTSTSLVEAFATPGVVNLTNFGCMAFSHFVKAANTDSWFMPYIGTSRLAATIVRANAEEQLCYTRIFKASISGNLRLVVACTGTPTGALTVDGDLGTPAYSTASNLIEGWWIPT